MKKKVSCFLPCRKGSERVPLKNTKPFFGHPNGLIELKLKQLLRAELIDEIILSTNDEEIIAYAKTLNANKVITHQRSERLSSSSTSTDELVAHALELVPDSHILWTHVTSPFITALHYDEMLNCYFEKLESGYDSLMSITEIHGFLWNESQPINYDRAKEKWPRTQTLPRTNEVNSAAFIASSKIYRNENDRIGKRPFLYSLNKLESYDIDWNEDFVLAECLAEKKLVKL